MSHSRATEATRLDGAVVGLRERIERYEHDAERLRSEQEFKDWPRSDREWFAHRCILLTMAKAREVTRQLAPTADWTLPPKSVQPHLDEFFDSMHVWIRSGDPRDFRSGHLASCRVIAAIRRTAGDEARHLS